jgi:hypothetical protein
VRSAAHNGTVLPSDDVEREVEVGPIRVDRATVIEEGFGSLRRVQYDDVGASDVRIDDIAILFAPLSEGQPFLARRPFKDWAEAVELVAVCIFRYIATHDCRRAGDPWGQGGMDPAWVCG